MITDKKSTVLEDSLLEIFELDIRIIPSFEERERTNFVPTQDFLCDTSSALPDGPASCIFTAPC